MGNSWKQAIRVTGTCPAEPRTDPLREQHLNYKGWRDGSAVGKLAALPEDLSWVPCTHIGQLTMT